MKKSLFALMGLVAFAFISCNKEKDIVDPIEKIKVFMSAPVSGNTLKSAAISTRQEIKEGDTVSVTNLQNEHIIVSAETEPGVQIKGYWSFQLIDSDDSYRPTDGNNYSRSSSSFGDLKLISLGLYKIVFESMSGYYWSFYLKHSGLPGDIGDDWQNYNIFRMEKGIFYKDINTPTKSGYTLFIKSTDFDFPRKTNYFAIINNDCDKSFLAGIGGIYTVYGVEKFVLKKCKYSDEYFYFTFFNEETKPNSGGQYLIQFCHGEYLEDWYFFQLTEKSDWCKNQYIRFTPM